MNDLLNRELVRLNYKFELPNFLKFNNDANDSCIEEEANNTKNNEISVMHHFSDEEEQPAANQKLVVKSALLHHNNHNNSRFTSATTRADEIDDDAKCKNKKEDIDENDSKKVLLLSNIDPTAWKKEFEKVSKQLEEFDDQMEKKPETLQSHFENDDFKRNLHDLSSLASVIIR